MPAATPETVCAHRFHGRPRRRRDRPDAPPRHRSATRPWVRILRVRNACRLSRSHTKPALTASSMPPECTWAPVGNRESESVSSTASEVIRTGNIVAPSEVRPPVAPPNLAVDAHRERVGVDLDAGQVVVVRHIGLAHLATSVTGTRRRLTASRSANPASMARAQRNAPTSRPPLPARRRTSAAAAPAGVSGSTRSHRPSPPRRSPALHHGDGRTPKMRAPRAPSRPACPPRPTRSRRPARAQRPGRSCISRCSARPGVIGRSVAGQGPTAALHHMGGLPGAEHDLTDPAHRLGVATDHGDRAHVVQQVFGGDGGRRMRLSANANPRAPAD